MAVNRDQNFVDPVTGAHTNSVESMWRDMKMKNKKMYGTDRNMIDTYLGEFLWRRYCKKHNLDPFDAILDNICEFNNKVLKN